MPDVCLRLTQSERGERVVQPRLRHRYQIDRHGLALSRHWLEGKGENVQFHFDTKGSGLVQVLGAIYAIERLDEQARHALSPVIQKAMRWKGPIGPSFITHLAGSTTTSLAAMADPRAWALDLFGFPLGTGKVSKRDVMTRYRQ